jgi:hypothetical protein
MPFLSNASNGVGEARNLTSGFMGGEPENRENLKNRENPEGIESEERASTRAEEGITRFRVPGAGFRVRVKVQGSVLGSVRFRVQQRTLSVNVNS